jgi:predicted CopG family antitoxin
MKEQKEQYSIKVSAEVLKKLRQLKLDWSCKSVDSVILRLFTVNKSRELLE